MTHLRKLVPWVAVLATACDVTTVCCDEGGADPKRVLRGQCAGTVVDFEECPGQVSVNTAPASCTEFCQGIVIACPETTQCLEDCAAADREPGDFEIECANDAVDCVGAATCWTFSDETFPQPFSPGLPAR